MTEYNSAYSFSHVERAPVTPATAPTIKEAASASHAGRIYLGAMYCGAWVVTDTFTLAQHQLS